jgi:hypothetical protein
MSTRVGVGTDGCVVVVVTGDRAVPSSRSAGGRGFGEVVEERVEVDACKE